MIGQRLGLEVARQRRVGREPVEQIAIFRAMPTMTLIRPADTTETGEAPVGATTLSGLARARRSTP